MRTVHRYSIRPYGEQTVTMPAGAVVVHVGVKPGYGLSLWAEVDTKQPEVTYAITVHQTGLEVAAGLAHLGTFALHDEDYIGHVYGPPELLKRGRP
jgi:hypothetical protein